MLLGSSVYALISAMLGLSLYMLISSKSNFKRLFGLNILQATIILLYISAGYINKAQAPIMTHGAAIIANPLPQVLMLTAIVVGVATLAVALALILRIEKDHRD